LLLDLTIYRGEIVGNVAALPGWAGVGFRILACVRTKVLEVISVELLSSRSPVAGTHGEAPLSPLQARDYSRLNRMF
ncbi:MAG TPA: hypothetical protein VNP73_04055, partial [Actinomycetota bacterium]|nr:hypothetical protein [Actinomycetota bacterium]